MSNLSDIGFPVTSGQDVNDVIMSAIPHAEEIRCPRGIYLKFSDSSGAEIYLQGNFNNELIGFNPHFAGKSSRLVRLAATVERDSSELDGGFHAWANPTGEKDDSGDYPFVFDVPDFRMNDRLDFPCNRQIQLTAFASNDFQIYADERAFDETQSSALKYAAKSFVPSGLFSLDEEQPAESQPPQPVGLFAGEIKDFALLTNGLSGEKFYWLLVETLGGEVDVVADPKLMTIEPNVGGIVRGQFWLSGRLI
jgi:hypothetical protein